MSDKKDKMFDARTGEWIDKEHAYGTASTIKDDKKRGYRARGAKGESVLISLRIPVELKSQVKELAKQSGRSQSEQIVMSVEDGLSLGNAMEAVRAYLSENPPPFAPDDWEPAPSECMSFILRTINDAIGGK